MYGIRRPCDGHRRGQFRIAESGKRADHAREHHREHDRRSRVRGGRLAGEYEDAGSDDRPDAECNEIGRTQHTFEPALVIRLHQRFDRFRPEEKHAWQGTRHSPPLLFRRIRFRGRGNRRLAEVGTGPAANPADSHRRIEDVGAIDGDDRRRARQPAAQGMDVACCEVRNLGALRALFCQSLPDFRDRHAGAIREPIVDQPLPGDAFVGTRGNVTGPATRRPPSSTRPLTSHSTRSSAFSIS